MEPRNAIGYDLVIIHAAVMSSLVLVVFSIYELGDGGVHVADETMAHLL